MPLEANDLSLSQSEDNDAVTRQATALVDGGRWRLCNDGKGLEREFKFKTFKATWVCLVTTIHGLSYGQHLSGGR